MNKSNIARIQQNKIKKGFGKERGKDYIPFIQAHENNVASEGWLTRHKGWKTERIHHTLSEHERRYLYYLEWVDEVVDIREQFPLLPLSRTEEIADQLGVKHPHVNGEGLVMTTDFNITLKTQSGEIDIVRTIKPASKLTKRTQELFEIERRFFIEQGINWGIVLGDKLPNTLIRNVEWMYEAKYLDTRPGIDQELIDLIITPLYKDISKDNGDTPINKICLNCDKRLGLEPGTSLFVLQYMLANKRWKTDMNVPIRESEPLQIINLESGLVNKNLG